MNWTGFGIWKLNCIALIFKIFTKHFWNWQKKYFKSCAILKKLWKILFQRQNGCFSIWQSNFSIDNQNINTRKSPMK